MKIQNLNFTSNSLKFKADPKDDPNTENSIISGVRKDFKVNSRSENPEQVDDGFSRRGATNGENTILIPSDESKEGKSRQ